MAEIKIKVTYADDNDWLALHIKPTEDETPACEMSECETLDGWIAIRLEGGLATLDLNPGKYLYRYEAGDTAENDIEVEIKQGTDVILPLTITIGSGGGVFGCDLFRVWSES